MVVLWHLILVMPEQFYQYFSNEGPVHTWSLKGNLPVETVCVKRTSGADWQQPLFTLPPEPNQQAYKIEF